MVAILAGIIVFLGFSLLAAWATIDSKNARIAELEALCEPPAKRVPWHVEVVRTEMSTLPEIWPVGEDDSAHDPTKVCPT